MKIIVFIIVLLFPLVVNATAIQGHNINGNLDVITGEYSSVSGINKFGRSSNVDNGVATDIWDRANSTDDQDTWTAPTQARTHFIASDDGNDTSAGYGARTIRVYGLTDWDTAEVNELVTLAGSSTVATSNSYVIIHRMKVVSSGTGGPNVGKITATAESDASITAQMNAMEGQTQMAIYGIPSTQTAYMTQYYSSALKASGASGAVNLSLLINEFPDDQVGVFIIKHTESLQQTGTTHVQHGWSPYYKITGPAIIKIQGNASANDFDVSAGFDLILIDN